ncbi:uncharacterized protein VTP21DRAFT_6703 [Calcarisporiella thermophila]|uniref:uncharacterized protein n=1 Tax=Calcarisporiella thermophila TaxID=911321 RepID=UPI0037432D9D
MNIVWINVAIITTLVLLGCAVSNAQPHHALPPFRLVERDPNQRQDDQKQKGKANNTKNNGQPKQQAKGTLNLSTIGILPSAGVLNPILPGTGTNAKSKGLGTSNAGMATPTSVKGAAGGAISVPDTISTTSSAIRGQLPNVSGSALATPTNDPNNPFSERVEGPMVTQLFAAAESRRPSTIVASLSLLSFVVGFWTL